MGFKCCVLILCFNLVFSYCVLISSSNTTIKFCVFACVFNVVSVRLGFSLVLDYCVLVLCLKCVCFSLVLCFSTVL